MKNENEEGKNDDENDAEEAYLKVTTTNCLNNGDDNEFDYDENVFNAQGDIQYDNSVADRQVEGESSSPSLHVQKEDVAGGIKDINPTVESDLVKDDVVGSDVAEWEREHAAATEEWSNVQEIEITSEANTEDRPNVSTAAIYSTEAIEYFQSRDLSEYNGKIKPTIQRTGVAALFNSLIGPVSLNKVLIPERDFIFTLALLQFDNSDEVYLRILYTVYKSLTKISIDCPRYGKHWESIGFQGNDPSTDLRGCGMLGLLTTLDFITSNKTAALASSIYHLSQDEMQHFPFCVMSINVTRVALQILREGKLNKECNKRYKASARASYQVGDYTGIAFEVFQEIFVAVFNRIYLTWKNEYKTMADSGFVMSDTEAYAKKKPMELIKSSKKKKTKVSDEGKVENIKGIDEL